MKSKVVVWGLVALVVASTTFFAQNALADHEQQPKAGEYFSTSFTLPHAIPSHEKELQDRLQSLTRIGSPYGIFYRVEKKVELPADEITTDAYNIKPETKEIVADFGVFVRK